MDIDRAQIQQKLEHIAEQLAAIRAKEVLVDRVGGFTETTFADEAAFHERRIVLMQWMLTASEAAIRARLAQEWAAVPGADALNGNVRGLPQELVEHIAFAELCQFALSEHPAQLAAGGDR